MAASCVLGQLDIHSASSYICFSPHQTSPLHWAADGGHVSTVKFLVEKGAKVNIKDVEGVSE